MRNMMSFLILNNSNTLLSHVRPYSSTFCEAGLHLCPGLPSRNSDYNDGGDMMMMITMMMKIMMLTAIISRS